MREGGKTMDEKTLHKYVRKKKKERKKDMDLVLLDLSNWFLIPIWWQLNVSQLGLMVGR